VRAIARAHLGAAERAWGKPVPACSIAHALATIVANAAADC